MSDDPFGRSEEDERDAFGNKLTGGDPLGSGTPADNLWSRPAPEKPSEWLPPEPARDAPPTARPEPPSWAPPATGTPAGSLAPGAQWPPPPDNANVRYATFAQRAGAAVLDFLIRLGLVLLGVLVGAVAYTAGGDAAGDVGITIGLIVGGIAGLAYAPWMIARTGGQTIGHRATGTRIEHVTGRRLTGGNAAVREIVVKAILFDGIGGFFVVPTLLNYLWPLWDGRNEALHDKMCSTRVVEA